MIYLYISPSCSSCRKAVKWFDEHKIEYKEKNILGVRLQREDIFRMLRNAENGFEDIISKRSKPYIDNNLDIDSMKTSELVDFIIDNPTILKRPIIIAENLMQVGYNSEEIRAFIPKELRNVNCDTCQDLEICEENLEDVIKEMRQAVASR